MRKRTSDRLNKLEVGKTATADDGVVVEKRLSRGSCDGCYFNYKDDCLGMACKSTTSGFKFVPVTVVTPVEITITKPEPSPRNTIEIDVSLLDHGFVQDMAANMLAESRCEVAEPLTPEMLMQYIQRVSQIHDFVAAYEAAKGDK